ncbi:long-chain fatty acid--CoA ligase [Bacillus sp. FJAT-29814]|uniref:long-chain-fatty-acid--CoA ligase n=1 Tax=Bacillus sp. FJAT-29814 TaxID=1729688 RepID=UPI000834DAF6|nr:long-chain fatty acid--CoA ligase [Bacillus sp. FJAT-29814]
MNIVDLLISTANRLPNQPAIKFQNQLITYEELIKDVLRLADGLNRKGFRRNTNIGLMMQNSPEYIISYYAILSIGATVVPINPLFKANEVTFILHNSDSVGILTDGLGISTVLEIQNEVKTLEKVVCFEKNINLKKVIKGHDLLQSGADFLPVRCNPDDTAHIIYTSGTTGRPKGVMITHANLNWLSITEAAILQVSSNDRVLCTLPLFHVYGNLQCMLAPFVQGATVQIIERFHADDVLETIVNEKITMYFGVPTMYTMLVQSPIISDLNFSTLRICASGGASISTEVIKKVKDLMKVDILEGYGQTESTAQITTNPYKGKQKIGSVGLPIPGVEVKIMNDDRVEVIQGEVGELVFRGPNAMKGYYNNTTETNEVIQDGWVYTGDFAYQDEEGYLYIVDRKKDLIIRGGYNVYPREIEEVLYKHDGIVECAVLGLEDQRLGEEVAAFIVCKYALNENDIKDHCQKYLVHYKIPRIIRFIDSLPKSSIGKILKRELTGININ